MVSLSKSLFYSLPTQLCQTRMGEQFSTEQEWSWGVFCICSGWPHAYWQPLLRTVMWQRCCLKKMKSFTHLHAWQCNWVGSTSNWHSRESVLFLLVFRLQILYIFLVYIPRFYVLLTTASVITTLWKIDTIKFYQHVLYNLKSNPHHFYSIRTLKKSCWLESCAD
jgi:hypothetical protein